MDWCQVQILQGCDLGISREKAMNSRFSFGYSNRWLLLALLLCQGSVLAADTVDFQYSDLQGKIHKLSDYRGKWVLVNYWATWCPPCLEELPELEIFHNNNKDKRAVVLGINMEEIDLAELQDFVEDQFVSYPILKGGENPGEPLGKVPGLPTSFLVTPRGEVVARQVGTVTAKGLETFIDNYEINVEGGAK